MKFKGLYKNKTFWIIFWDLLMITILLTNFFWIIFDWIFTFISVDLFLSEYLNGFYNFYIPIHAKFWFYDYLFVGLFILELTVRWGIAIKNRTYHRWFFYPFIHWYDALGCIPIGSWRMLRILRVISILLRLQRLQIIDLSKNFIIKKINKYFGVLMEEVSDRVIVNMIDGVQDELDKGTPVIKKIIDEIIYPKKQILVEMITVQIRDVLKDTHPKYENELKEYVNHRVSLSIKKTPEVKVINKVPVFGSVVSSAIEKIVSDVVFHVINDFLTDISSAKNTDIVNNITEMFFESILNNIKTEENLVFEEIVSDSLELVKNNVKIQRWKLKEIEERKEQIRKKFDKQKKGKSLKQIEKLEAEEKEAIISDPLINIEESLKL